MADLLPENVTLFDLLSEKRLSNPARYLRLALANVLRAGEFGTVTLRIGRTGTGTWPAYILEKGGVMLNRFDGQSHDPWTGKIVHHDENWSNKPMTASDLHDQWKNVLL